MRVLKNFTDGIAILLAVFILLYTVTLYVKFKPDEKEIESGESKAVLFLEESQTNKDCLRLIFVLTISGLAGFLFRRRPEFSAAFAVFTLCFILIMFDYNMIPKRPMVIISLTAAHTFGSLAYCIDFDKKTGGFSCPNTGILCGAGAMTLAVTALGYQHSALKSADSIKILKENGVSFPENIKFVPQLAELIKRKFLSDGEFEAEDVAYDFSSELKFETVKSHFLDTVTEEQFTIYLRLIILLFAAVVICFAFRNRNRWLAAIASSIPLIYCIFQMSFDRLSAMPLPIIVCTLCMALCHFASFESEGSPDAEKSENDQNGLDTVTDISDSEKTADSDTVSAQSETSVSTADLPDNQDAENEYGSAVSSEPYEEIYYS